jgi:hypothetical protein
VPSRVDLSKSSERRSLKIVRAIATAPAVAERTKVAITSLFLIAAALIHRVSVFRSDLTPAAKVVLA